jgi:hypothetical protein
VRALLVYAGVVLAAAGCGGEEAASDLPLGKRVAATATLDPTVHVFAEPVTATVEVVVDTEQVDPDRVRIETEFLPYDVKAERESREDRGRFVVLRRESVLRCLRLDCIPEILQSAAGEAETGRGERRVMRLPASRVVYEDDDGKERVLQKAAWPEVVSVSRLKQSDVPQFDRFIFKTGVTPLAEPDYRVSPTLLGIGLLAAALALLALPAVLVARWVRARRPVPVVEEEPELTPLERALRLVEWANDRADGVERREALEHLAVELEAIERAELARSARMLAWSPASPSPEGAGRLVSDVRSAVDGG